MNDSRWYYGVVAVMVLEAIGFGLIDVSGLGQLDPAKLGTGLFGALLVGIAFLLLPVYALCIYLDARAVSEANESWNPNPKVWALGAVVVQLVGLSAGVTMYIFISIGYLFRRFRSSPAAVVDEEAWAEQEAQWEDEAGTQES